jgi:hypothetical protein
MIAEIVPCENFDIFGFDPHIQETLLLSLFSVHPLQELHLYKSRNKHVHIFVMPFYVI